MHHELGQTPRVREGLIHRYVRQCWLLAGHLGPAHARSPASNVDRLPWSKKAAFQERDTQAARACKGWAQTWHSVAVFLHSVHHRISYQARPDPNGGNRPSLE